MKNTNTYSEYISESDASNKVIRWLRSKVKPTVKATNHRLVKAISSAIKALLANSEAKLLEKQVQSHSNTLVSAYENVKSTARLLESAIRHGNEADLSECGLKMREASITARQLAHALLQILDDYVRSSSKSGKLRRTTAPNAAIIKEAHDSLTVISDVTDHASKATAFLVIGKHNAAQQQIKKILSAPL